MKIPNIINFIYGNYNCPNIIKTADDLICFFKKNIITPIEKKQKECMIAIISFHGNALQFASEELQTDERVVRIAIRQNIQSLRFAHKNLKRDQLFTNPIFEEHKIHTLEGKIDALGISPKDRSFIISLEEKNKNDLIPIAFQLSFGEGISKELNSANPEVKNNEEFMLTLASIDIQALEHVGEELKKNERFMLTAAQIDIKALQFADETLTQNKEFMLAAAQIDIRTLQFADETLKQNKEFMLAAARIDIRTLQFADETLKQNKEFMLAAAQINIKTVRYANETLKQDEKFLFPLFQEKNMISLEKMTEALGYSSAHYFFYCNRNNDLMIKQALKFSFTLEEIKAFKNIDKDLKKNEEFMLIAAQNNVTLLKHACNSLKENPNFIRAAAKQNINALQYASQKLLQNQNFLQSIFEENKIISFENQIMALGFDPQDKFLVFFLISIKNHSLIKLALTASFSMKTRDLPGRRALDLVILQEDAETLQIFINHFPRSIGYSYLQLAARRGWEKGVEMLLPLFNQSDLLKTEITSLNDKNPTTLLHDAVYSGNLPLVEALVRYGFKINQITYGKEEYSHSETIDEGYNTEYTSPVYKYTYVQVSPLAIARIFHPQNKELNNYLKINGGKDSVSWSINTLKIKEMFDQYSDIRT